MGSPSRRRHGGRVEHGRGRTGKDGEGRGSGAERYFDVEGDVDDFLESDDDFESDDFLPLSLDDVDDESDFESDFSDLPEDSDESFESLPIRRAVGVRAWPRSGCRCGGSPSP